MTSVAASQPRLLDRKRIAGVYVIDCDQGTKIGITQDIASRLREIGRASGHTPRLFRMFEMPAKQATIVEAWAHRELDADRTVGEWFHTHPVEAADVVSRIARDCPHRRPLAPEIEEAAVTWLERNKAES